MATDTRLRARIQPSHAEHIEDYADAQGFEKRVDAEREIVKTGLEAIGYIDRPTEGHEVFLWYVRRIGLVLGFVGLIVMGYGVFGPRINSIVGFGLLLTGFLFVALEEFIAAWARRRSSTETTPMDLDDVRA